MYNVSIVCVKLIFKISKDAFLFKTGNVLFFNFNADFIIEKIDWQNPILNII